MFRMIRSPLLSGLVATILVHAGCGASQSIEQPMGNGDTVDAGSGGSIVQVTFNGTTTPVDLASPTPVDVDGVALARLSDVLALAVAPASVDQLKVANFLGADGYSTLSKSNCVAVLPINAAALANGYIDPVTRNLKWDASLGYPGCLSVKDTAEIVVEPQ